ncbi:hypothetical protein A2U01_0036213 [Trifolium medium]|uniref:Uncharacterized protein n=1 Tax=Trifolium medium TaxID=97028 RepID=A0A392PSK2_9FABA|nr:hypothetical protein [Trifolium medium]
MHEFISMAVGNVERQFFKVGPNSSTDPHIDAIAGESVNIGGAAAEMELPNVARFAEGENGVHEKCKLSELVRSFAVTFGVIIREVEDLLMLPKVAPSARNEAHSRDRGFGREE